MQIPETTHMPTGTAPSYDGIRVFYQFPNGHGASVIRDGRSYGNEYGLWEMALIRWPEWSRVHWSTILPNDIEGWLTDEAVQDWLDKIAALPALDSTEWLARVEAEATLVHDKAVTVAADAKRAAIEAAAQVAAEFTADTP